jgi:two-component system, LytTR family, sensor kinase
MSRMQIGTLRLGTNQLVTVVIVVLGFCLLDIIHGYIGAVGVGAQLPWQYLLFGFPQFWIAYLPLMPLAIWIDSRYRLRLGQPRTLLPHVVAALVFSYAHMLVAAAAPNLLGVLHPEWSFWTRFFVLMQFNFAADFLTYWAFLGALSAAKHYSELRHQQVTEAQLEASLIQAHLQSLHAQLRPHFFFNTLQAISVLALKGDKHGVVETLGHLGNMVRLSFDSRRPQKAALASELDFLDEYLAIERVSRGELFRVERRICPETVTALVPAMLLQPIVENAIVHGVARREGSGAITLTSARAGDQLHLTVDDSGPGFTGTTTDGVGLANTRARLDLLYGGSARLELRTSSLLGGGCVFIALPYETSTIAASYEEAMTA